MKSLPRKLLMAGLMLPLLLALPAVALDDDSADMDIDLQGGVRDLFPGDLFPDSKTSPQSSGSSSSAASSSSASSSTAQMEQKMSQQLQNYQLDLQLRTQMQRVAGWLQEFGLRNQGRFPGLETGDEGGLKRQAMVQLTELVGSNPYAGGGTSTNPTVGELNGLGPGISYFYNSNGTPVTGSPIASDEWTSEITAENAGRINLQLDLGLTQGEIESFRNDPPTSWEAAPGTITAMGNGQGFICVWGAGRDGKPIPEGPSSKRPLVITKQITGTVDDQNAPNEGQVD